ncbi:MAG TPA: response regulator transcription factor [Roseiflexaceae bacterium]|nr:response regulator transcription factor [Roseiflexaceae bacterium]
MSDPIRVLIADDHLVVREGLRLILETSGTFVCAGEAADGAEAVRLAQELRPDVVLMDLRMPGVDGLAAIEQLRARTPEIAVVILTTYNEDELMIRGLRAGARGFLLKDTSRERLFDAMHAAVRGETLLSPDILARVLMSGETRPSQPNGILTEREHAVLQGVARGERSKEIAARLGITERTVKAHLANIYGKYGVDSRAAAVAAAMARGDLTQPEE